MNRVYLYNRKRDMPWTFSGNVEYIGRGGRWGNRFEIGKHGTRDECCDMFELYQLPTLDVEPLRGKSLLCSCAPERCHGHSIFFKLYGTREPWKCDIINS